MIKSKTLKSNIFLSAIFFLVIIGVGLLSGSSREWVGLKLVFNALSAVALCMFFIFKGDALNRDRLRVLAMFFIAIVILALIQLLPFRPDNGSALYKNIKDGHNVLGLTDYRATFTLSPAGTGFAISNFLLPFAAILLVIWGEKRISMRVLSWIIPAIAALSALLGLGQLMMGGDGSLYLYDLTNKGSPVGLFANVNHQGTLLNMAVPFMAYIFKRSYGVEKQLVLITAILVIVALLLTKSLAAYGLFGLIVCGSAYAFWGKSLRSSLSFLKRRKFQILILSVVLLGLFLAWSLNLHNDLLVALGVENDSSISRKNIWIESIDIISNHWLFGTGLGSYADVYRFYEGDVRLSSSYINHAHNDYIEWFVETGLIGMALLFAVLTWLVNQFFQIWSGEKSDGLRPIRRAAIIAVIVPLLHSFVDYPARTATITVLIGVCLGLLLVERPKKSKSITQKSLSL